MSDYWDTLKPKVGLSSERQLRLLEIRHAMALRFIDAHKLRIQYDRWMASQGLASEFVTGTYQPSEHRHPEGDE